MNKLKKVFKIFILFSVLLIQIFSTNYIGTNKQVSALGNKGDLVLTVLSHEDNKGIAEATFDLKNSLNQVVNQLVTDTNGRANIIGLSAGNYKLVQKTTGIGHMLPRNNEYDVSIQDGVTTYRTITNNKRTASEPIPIDSEARDSTTLRLKVVNGNDRNQGVSGSKFILKGDTVLREITTGRDGTVNVEGLTYGTYSLTQISAPDGYLPIDKETTFEIPKPSLVPSGIKYAEFKDVQIDNIPYDKSRYGVLNVSVFDDGNRSTRIPKVTLKLTDTYNNKIYLGTTDSNGNVKFKGISPGPQRKFKIEAVRTPYDYEGSGFKFEETFNVPLIGGRNQDIYLPKKPLRHLTINNYEKGSFSTKIGGGTFKLYHEDGTSEVITIGPNGVLNKDIPSGDYILEQLTSDGAHIVNSARIPFKLAREVELNIENELVNPDSKKVSMTFNKVWVDKPSKETNSTIYLYANGEKTNKSIEISSNDEAEKTFSDLPKFDSNHNTITYSLKEEAVDGYYPVYEQKPDGKWTIKNYSGTQHGICAPPIVWMSTANNATSFRLKNGIFANQEINFPNDAQYGQSLAYQKEGTLLFAAGIEGGENSDNKNAKLVVYDVSKGENGKLVKNVSLGDLGLGSRGYSFISNNFAHQNSKNFHWRHNKVNTMGISSDQKYILVKHNVVPEIHFFRISDILHTPEGGTVRPAKIVDASFPTTKTGYRPLSDGDIVQYPNGDILFTGHQFIGNGIATTRERYRFYLLKYNGDTNDIAKGSYGPAKNVGVLPHIRQDATVTYNWQGGSPEPQSNIEGLAIVSPRPGEYKLYAATNNGSIKITGATGTDWSGSVHKGWAEVTINDNGAPAMPGWQGIGGEDFAFKLKPVSVGTDVDTKLNAVTGGRPALITDMTAAEGDSCFITTSVRGAKIWQGDDESTRPNSITVRLFADGVDTGKTQVVTKANNWAYEFTDLDKYKLDAGSNDTGTAIVYTVKEDNVPKGYSYKQEEGTYNIVNTYEKGSFQFRKTNKAKNTNLPGATFTLYNEDKSKIVATSTSDVNGIVKFDNLTEGNYKLEETVAPNGYELSRQEYTVKARIDQGTNKLGFTLLNNDTPVETDGTNHIITNDNEKNAKLIIRKNDDAGSPLNGATFRMTNLSDNTTVEQTTGDNGEIVFNNLKIGKYKLEETRVPSGFKDPTSTYEVTVTSDLRVLVNTIEKINTTPSNRFRSAVYREDPIIANSRFTMIENSFFRSATDNNLVSTIPEPYHKNNNPETISSNNITTKQNISATTTKGKYKVDVEVSGSGMVNEGSVYVFAIEKSKWTDGSINFRDILSDEFKKIRQKDPNARVGVITSTNNISEQVIYMTDINTAIRNVNSIATSYYDKNINSRNFGNVLLKAKEFFTLVGNNATAKNKVLVHFMSTGIGGGEATYIENEIRDPLSQLRSLGVTHKIIHQGTYTNPSKYYSGVPIETFSGDKKEFAKGKISEMINATKVGPGRVNITLNNNVTFDGFVNPNNDLNIQGSNQIVANNISRRVTGNVEPYRFSYYVRSNTDNARLNEFIDINTSATFKPYTDDSVVASIPIPKVAVPGIQFKVNKSYTDSVTPEMRADTTIHLLKNGTSVESMTLNAGTEKFNTVQPVFDNNGNIINYSIREEGISNKLYSNINPTTISGNNGTFNVITDLASLNLKVTKEWVTDNTKPVRVKLIAKVGDREINIRNLGYSGDIEKDINASTVVNGEAWATVFENIPRKTNNGESITYEVREISVGDNTNPANDYKIEYFTNEESIKVVNTEHTRLFITNYRDNKSYKFKIKKVAYDNENQLLTGNINTSARILILDSQKHPISGEVANLTDGELIFQRGGAKYSPGVYYIKEERAPETYKLLEKLVKIEISTTGDIRILGYENENDGTITTDDNMATISKSQTDSELIEIKLKNKQKKYPIKIVKIKANGDKITNSDTRFVIKSADTNGESDIVNIGGNQSATFRGEYTFNPGNAGNEGFPPGTYYIREITAPNGYKLLNRNIKVEITEQGGIKVDDQDITRDSELNNNDLKVSYDNNGLITLQVKNKKLFNLHIKKRVKSEVEALGNITSSNQLDRTNRKLTATFNLQKENGTDNWQNIRADITTNNGYASIEGLEEGKYSLTETAAPDGYIRLDNPVKFTVNSSGVITLDSSGNDAVAFSHNNSTMELVVAVKNEQVTAKFAISKRIKGIERTGRHITSPVTFQLTKDGDNNFNAINLTKTANENFVFENLKVGTYTLKETQVPSGYVKAKEYYKVVVENNGDLVFKTYTDPQNGQSTETVSYDGSNLTLHKQSEKRITKSEQSNIDNNLRDDNKLILIGNIQNPKLKLRKVNTNNELIQNSNAVFNLYKIDNNSNNSIERNSISGNPVLTLNVGNNGESNEISPLTLTELGKYALVEETAPNGYERIEKPVVLEFYEKDQVHSPGVNKKVTDFRVLSDEFRNTVNISREQNDPNLMLLAVKNTKIVDFSIRKLNDNTNKLLNGVSFKLAPKDSKTPDPAFDDLNWHITNMAGSEGTEQIDGKNRKVIKWTHQNGKVPGIRVKEGIYVLTEESAPNTHEPIPPLEILVDSTGVKANPKSTLEVKANTVEWPSANTQGRPNIIIRNFKRPQITIEKVGENGITKLAGVRLKIKSKDVNTPKPLFDNLSWHERNMAAVVPNSPNEKWISWQTHATEIPGLVLREGIYTIEEESVPDGYIKFKPFDIRVDKSGNMTIQNNSNKQGIVSEITNDTGKQRLRLVLKNEKNPKIKIKKVSTLGDTPLTGVKFQLFEENGTTPIGVEKTTSNQGIVEFEGLIINKTYVIKETQTLPNHVLNDKKYRFKINSDGNIEVENIDDKFIIGTKEQGTNVVTIKNDPKKSEYPATGGFGTIVTTALGLFITAISSIMIYRRKRQN